MYQYSYFYQDWLMSREGLVQELPFKPIEEEKKTMTASDNP